MIITFSGIDGSGKTTICKHLTNYYNEINIKSKYVYLGDYFLLKYIVKILHYVHNLFILKNKHNKSKKNPFLGHKKRNAIFKFWTILALIDSIIEQNYLRFKYRKFLIFCDRGPYDRLSGLSYNGYSNNLINSFFLKIIPKADISFILDTTVKIAQKREHTDFHKKDFFIKQRAFYKNISTKSNIRLINTTLSKKSVYKKIVRIVSQYKSNKNSSFANFSIIFFLFLFFISFKNILNNNSIGYVWDWGYPLNSDQAWERLARGFSAWYSKISLGTTNSYISSAIPVSGLIYILSILPGYWGQRVFILIVYAIAYAGSLKLTGLLGFTRIVRIVISLVFTFSAPMYSRLVAGHTEILAGYTFIPFIFYFLFRSFKRNNIADIFISVLIFTAASAHFLSVFNVFIGLFVVFIVNVFKNMRQSIRIYLIFIFSYLFLNFFWIFPFLANSILGTVSFKDNISVIDEASVRWQIFIRSPLRIFDPFGLSAPTGMHTEYVFPMPYYLLILRYLIYISFFLYAIFRLNYKKNKYTIIFFIIAIISIILVLGSKTIVGFLIYSWILKIVPPVFFLFSITNRFNLILNFSLIFLFGFVLDHLLVRFSKIKLLIPFLFLIVSVYPFLRGNITRPVNGGTQPLSLFQRSFTRDENNLSRYIGKMDKTSRFMFIPSGHNGYIPTSVYAYPWLYHLYPRDEFYSHSGAGSDFGKYVYSTVYGKNISTVNFSSLIGWAAVENICIYDKNHYLYNSFGYLPSRMYQTESLFDPQDDLDKFFTKQTGFSNQVSFTDNLTCHTNDNYIPRITGFESVILSTGDFNVINNPKITGRRPVLFLTQVQKGQLPNQPGYLLIQPERFSDVYLPFIEPDYIYNAGNFATGFFGDWYPGVQKWDISPNRQAYLEKYGFAQSEKKSDLVINLRSKTKEKVKVFLEVYVGPDSGTVNFKTGNYSKTLDLKAKIDRGFIWYELNNVIVKDKITLTNINGINSIGKIIVYPQDEWKNVEQSVGAFISNNYLTIDLEAENYVASESGIYYDSNLSLGAGAKENIQTTLNLPSGKSVHVEIKYMQLKTNFTNPLIFSINNNTVVIPINIRNIGHKSELINIKLNPGKNKIALVIPAGIILDEVIFREQQNDSGLNKLGSLNFKRLNPSEYEIKANYLKPPYIYFAENYSQKWELYCQNQIIKSLKVNGFGNLYDISGSDCTEYNLIYSDQKYLDTGLRASIVCLIFIVLFICFNKKNIFTNLNNISKNIRFHKRRRSN